MSSILTLEGLLERSASEAVGFGLGTALGHALEPEAIDLAQESFSLNPSLALDPNVLALLVRLARADEGAAAGDAAKSGVSGDRFHQLIQATRLPPGTAELIELNRRGEIADGELVAWLEMAGVDDRIVERVATLKQVHLAPADAAMARQQGFLDPSQQYAYAALGGYSQADAELQYLVSGLPPGIGEGLELLRRGEIDVARFTEYVIEGHTKPKFLPDLLALRRTLLSPAVYAEALVRQRVSQADAVAGAAKWGIEPADFLLWSNMLGRPPGIGEALTLVNRGVPGPPDSAASIAWFRDVVARSDVRTEFAADLYQLRFHFPSFFQILRAVQNSTAPDDLARRTLLLEGYTPEWIDAVIASAHKAKTAAHKPLALSVVETAYDAGLESHAQALAAVESLGYDPAEAEELLQLHEARRIVSELAHGVAIVRSRYVGWKIDEATARGELATLQLAPDAIDQRLRWWNGERDASRPALTTAEVTAAFHYNRFTYDEAVQHLLRLGWAEEDALTLLWVRAHGDPRA